MRNEPGRQEPKEEKAAQAELSAASQEVQETQGGAGCAEEEGA